MIFGASLGWRIVEIYTQIWGIHFREWGGSNIGLCCQFRSLGQLARHHFGVFRVPGEFGCFSFGPYRHSGYDRSPTGMLLGFWLLQWFVAEVSYSSLKMFSTYTSVGVAQMSIYLPSFEASLNLGGFIAVAGRH